MSCPHCAAELVDCSCEREPSREEGQEIDGSEGREDDHDVDNGGAIGATSSNETGDRGAIGEIRRNCPIQISCGDSLEGDVWYNFPSLSKVKKEFGYGDQSYIGHAVTTRSMCLGLYWWQSSNIDTSLRTKTHDQMLAHFKSHVRPSRVILEIRLF